MTKEIAKTKTAVEIGEGARVIRRTESMQFQRERPLVGEVVAVLDNGKLRVRWAGAYLSFRLGWQPMHSTLRPGALLPATEENIAASQRRMYVRMEKGYGETVEEYDRRADAIDARGGESAVERRVAEEYRARRQEVRRRLEGKGATRSVGNWSVVVE